MNSSWNTYEITIKNSSASIMDEINYELFEMGAIGVEIVQSNQYMTETSDHFGTIRDSVASVDEDIVCAYFESKQTIEKLRSALIRYMDEQDFEILETTTVQEDWQLNWKQYYQQERLSRYLVVNPVWKEYQTTDSEKVIQIDPGLAFGTGNHQTTRLSAQALEMIMKGNETIYDVGTGSGILSFVAGCLGASKVQGFDLDSQAIDAANNNLTLQTESAIKDLITHQQISFAENDLLNGITEPVDIIVANILPHILVNLFADATRLIHPGGYLILGGILAEKSDFIEEEMSKYPFDLKLFLRNEQWTGFVYQKVEE